MVTLYCILTCRTTKVSLSKSDPLAMMRIILALFALLAVASALNVYTPVAVHTASGVGTVSPGAPYGTPTLSLAAFQVGSAAEGNFQIYYPADADYSGGETVVTGAVTCFQLDGDGITAYVTLRIDTSSGPRSSIFPVGNYISAGIQAGNINFSAGTYTDACASILTPSLALTEGSYIVF